MGPARNALPTRATPDQIITQAHPSHWTGGTIKSGNNTDISNSSDCNSSNTKHTTRGQDKIRDNSRPFHLQTFEAALRSTDHKPNPNPNPTPTPKETEPNTSDPEEGEITEQAQQPDPSASASNTENPQPGLSPARHHQKRHTANPPPPSDMATKPRKPLQTVSPNKHDGSTQKGHAYKTSADPVVSSSCVDRSGRLHASVFAGELGKSRWVFEGNIGDMY